MQVGLQSAYPDLPGLVISHTNLPSRPWSLAARSPLPTLVSGNKVSTEYVLTGQRWPTLYKSLFLDTQHNYSAMAKYTE
jgi:hypothetical protein